MQDYDLCEACERNLNAGVYFAGALQPEKENGTLFYQSLVRKMVLEHLALERQRGEKINPAYAGLKAAMRPGRTDKRDSIAGVLEMERICKGLENCFRIGEDEQEELW
jgi:hypothetical protein